MSPGDVADVDEVKLHRCAGRVGPADQVAKERQAGADVMFRERRADHHRRVYGYRLYAIGVLVRELPQQAFRLRLAHAVGIKP